MSDCEYCALGSCCLLACQPWSSLAPSSRVARGRVQVGTCVRAQCAVQDPICPHAAAYGGRNGECETYLETCAEPNGPQGPRAAVQRLRSLTFTPPALVRISRPLPPFLDEMRAVKFRLETDAEPNAQQVHPKGNVNLRFRSDEAVLIHSPFL